MPSLVGKSQSGDSVSQAASIAAEHQHAPAYPAFLHRVGDALQHVGSEIEDIVKHIWKK